MNVANLRVGILTQGGSDWLGGVNYVNNLFKSLALLPKPKRPNLSLIVLVQHIPAFELYAPATAIADQVLIVYPGPVPQQNGKVRFISSLGEAFKYIDFAYPASPDALPDQPAAAWIPDFQHCFLPQYFSLEERTSRDTLFGLIAEKARMVVFSSDSARKDFEQLYPQARAVTRVLRFSSIPDDAWFEGDTEGVRCKYDLPNDFLMCCNQFWQHKDHRTLFRALAVLRAKGIILHVACTGHTEDYRNPEYFKGLMREVRNLGIHEQVHVLGVIDRLEQIQLLRRALAVIQPSLFEGWSTVVEDCRVLGKTMFLSDFPVHVEQKPQHGIYYRKGNAQELADKLARHLPELARTDGTVRENEARAAAQERMMLFGLEFSKIATEGQALNPSDAGRCPVA